jgi:DNA-binding FrmR family transcriptional regulator
VSAMAHGNFGVASMADRQAGCQLLATSHLLYDRLMAEVIEGHIRFHVIDADHRATFPDSSKAAQELIDVIKMNLK